MKHLTLIDELKRRRDLNDSEVARLLGVHRQTISAWRKRDSHPDDYACLRLAQELDLDPLTVLAEIRKDCEKDATRAQWWAGFFRSLRQVSRTRSPHCAAIFAAALSASVGFSSIPPPFPDEITSKEEEKLYISRHYTHLRPRERQLTVSPNSQAIAIR